MQEDGVFNEVRVAVVGNVDSGKSTLLGVLSKGILDNGRGLARLNVFRHKHEVETGRTSDISKEILGFNDAAQPVNYSPVKTPTWPEICEHSSKVVMFMDLAGHEKYLKTTVFGLTGALRALNSVRCSVNAQPERCVSFSYIPRVLTSAQATTPTTR